MSELKKAKKKMQSLEVERMYQHMRPYEVLQAEMQRLH